MNKSPEKKKRVKFSTTLDPETSCPPEQKSNPSIDDDEDYFPVFINFSEIMPCLE